MTEKAIKVAVRSRPLLPTEESVSPDVLWFEDNTTVQAKGKLYKFEHVFRAHESNEKVYNDVVAAKMAQIFEGYNVTILAYGSTGSGKTHTMGTDSRSILNADIGMIPRGMAAIFQTVESQKETIDTVVKVSFLELYKENIFDLLNNMAVCTLRDTISTHDSTIKILNLSETRVKSVEDTMKALEKGSAFRHTAATAKNFKSSRSHAIFCINVEQTDKSTQHFKRSKFQLVDLAGSERVSSSGTSGEQLKEGCQINMGLLALRKVLNSLVDGSTYVPYRDSKLTRILQDCFGGNSYTVMIACINPSASSLEDTMSTLRYASTALSIKNKPIVNTESTKSQISKLKKQIEALQTELEAYRAGSDPAVPSDALKGTESFQRQLSLAYQEIARLNLKLIPIEERCAKLTEDFKSLHEKIRNIIEIMKGSPEGNTVFGEQLKALEEELANFCQNMNLNLTVSLNDEVEVSDEGDTEMQETCDDIPSAESSVVEDKENSLLYIQKQQESACALSQVNEKMELKTKLALAIEKANNAMDPNVNQTTIDAMMQEIDRLIKKKEELEKETKVAKEKKDAAVDVVEKARQEIETLQKELNNKKAAFKKKVENEETIRQLKNDLQELKKMKVTLLKQLRMDSNRFSKIQQQKDKDIAKLLREQSRKDYEFKKMKTTLETKLNVMKQKMDETTIANKRLQDALKKRPQGQSRPVPILSRTGLEESIDDQLDVKEKQVEAMICYDMTIEEINKMRDCLKQKEHEEMDKEEVNTLLEEMRASYIASQQTLEKYSKLPKTSEIYKLPSVLEDIRTLTTAKIVIEKIFKKFLTLGESSARNKYFNETQIRQLENQLNIQNEENQSLKEKCKILESDIARCQNECENKIEEFKLNFINESKDLDVLRSEYDNLKKEKDREIESLNLKIVQLINLEKKKFGETTSWMPVMSSHPVTEGEPPRKQKRTERMADVSGSPISGILMESQNLTYSDGQDVDMVGAYLDETMNESRGDDQNDPDWRMTPLYKQTRISRFAQKEKSDEKVGACKCKGGCNTLRCRCKKNGSSCGELCLCNKELCKNGKIPKVEPAATVTS